VKEQNELARVEFFSDAVLAIAATLLVLELKVPEVDSTISTSDAWYKFTGLWPSLLGFILSFGMILIIWVNHYYTLRLINKSSKKFLYANGFLLFTISVLPFPTAVLAEYINTPKAAIGVTLYSFISLMINVAWYIWWITMLKPVPLIKPEISKVRIKKIVSHEKTGIYLYALATAVSFWFPLIGIIFLAALSVLWISISILERS
jgi:uncharacterized membrane protein